MYHWGWSRKNNRALVGSGDGTSDDNDNYDTCNDWVIIVGIVVVNKKERKRKVTCYDHVLKTIHDLFVRLG